MSDLCLPLFWGGYGHVVMRVCYDKYTINLNAQRLSQGLPPMDRITSEQVWRITITWYFAHFNPTDRRQKTQRSINNAIAQIPKFREKMDSYYETIQHLLTEEAIKACKISDLTKIGPHLESQIPTIKQDQSETFWLEDWTPIIRKGKQLNLDFQNSVKKLEIKDTQGPKTPPRVQGFSKLTTPPRKIWGAERPVTPTYEATYEKWGGEILGAPWAISPKREETVIEPLGENRKRGRSEREDEDDGIDVKMGGTDGRDEVVVGEIKKVKVEI